MSAAKQHSSLGERKITENLNSKAIQICWFDLRNPRIAAWVGSAMGWHLLKDLNVYVPVFLEALWKLPGNLVLSPHKTKTFTMFIYTVTIFQYYGITKCHPRLDYATKHAR